VSPATGHPPAAEHGADTRRLRILVIDDHEVVRWGFRLMFARLPWVERCLSAGTGAEALAICRRYQPHVAIVDLLLAGESGAEVCARLRAQAPAPQVLLTSGAGGISPRAARAAGAAGFIPKDSSARDMARIVRLVGEGKEVFDHGAGSSPALSGREREVLGLIAGGATNREIAQALFLSPHTIKEHTSTLYRKLGARNRADAVQRAQSLGIAPERLDGARGEPPAPGQVA
jgi:two-component system response regulator DesR